MSVVAFPATTSRAFFFELNDEKTDGKERARNVNSRTETKKTGQGETES